ncbi:MAG TPA: tripartite tricarboxylate transporter substrate binding protein [Burkholderiales bacterium]|jgi:tripartite-type tricarboxylate transporter receptor subunit TctC|nr:tripartite tricarboxylate transporter substrate binding protein [Burkholderiales bacterium]
MRKIAGIIVMIIAACAANAHADTYPSRPIRLVVGYAVGGGTDIIARLTAQYLGTRLNGSIVVDNKPGAGGNIATENVAKSPADGYTLLLAVNNVTINPYLYKTMNVDVARELRGVGIIANSPIVLVASNDAPFKNLPEMLAYARKNPGKISYGTPGIGTPQHLAVELLDSMASVSMTHVPYKGSAQSLSDLMAGQLQLVSAAINSAQPFVKAAKIRGIAVADPKRVAALSELPAVGEVVKGYSVSIWYGLMAPAQTPNDIVQRLNAELHKTVEIPEMAEKMVAQGYVNAVDTPEQMDATVRADLAKWGKVVKSAGIAPE